MKILRLAFLVASLSTIAQLTYALDDSSRINSAIKSAIAAGQTEYVLPTGVYYLQNPIVIPPGTKHFTLRGEGPDSTVLKTPDKNIGQAINVGVIPVRFNNYGIADKPCTPVTSVKTGDTILYAANGSTSLKPGYYVLFDDYKIVCSNSPYYEALNHAEIVKVVAVNSTGTQFMIDAPAGREYTTNARLADVNADICVDISVENMGFDGNATTTASKGILSVGVVDGMVADGLKVRNFLSEGITTNTTRNALIQNCDIGEAFGSGGVGDGYGYTIYRSRFVTLLNCRAQNVNANSGYTLHSGTLDTLIDHCTGVDKAKFDLHGYDERRATFKNCTGPQIAIGNSAWRGGERDIIVQDSSFTGGLFLGTNAKNIRVSRCAFGGAVTLESLSGTTGTPSGGYPDQIYVEDSSFIGSNYSVMMDSTKAGTLLFSRCTFTNTNKDWGAAVRVSQMEGTLNFVDCTFYTSSGREPFEIYDSKAKFVLLIKGCTLKSAWAKTAVYVKSTFCGKTSIFNSKFITGATGTLKFIQDDSRKVISSSNTVTKL